MSLLNNKPKSATGDEVNHIYYNVIIPNNPDGLDLPTGTATPATFVENRVQPLMKVPSDWEMAIVRFSVPTSQIPIFVMPLIDQFNTNWDASVPYALGDRVDYNGYGYTALVGNTNKVPSSSPAFWTLSVWSALISYTQDDIVKYNGALYVAVYDGINLGNQPDISPLYWVNLALLSKYSVTLSYPGSPDAHVHLIYVPQNISLATPTAPVDNIIQKSSFYYVYSYQHMLGMINTALATAYAIMTITAPASPPVLAGAPAPFMEYDVNTGSMSLVAHQSFSVNYTVVPTISIWMNILYKFFSPSLHSFFQTPSAQTDEDGKLVNIEVLDEGNNRIQPPNIIAYPPGPGGQPLYLKMSQEYPTLSDWSDFANLVFTTTSIPVMKEYIPQLQGSGSDNSRQILTDFIPSFGTSLSDNARNVLQFYPQGPYRWVTMQSNVPLMKLDLGIFWQDLDNELFPIQIPYGTSASVKILFRRKSHKNADY